MRRILFLVTWMCAVPVSLTPAADWPMWRHDPARSGAAVDALPSTLSVAWWRDLPANHIAWGEDPRIQFDATHEPRWIRVRVRCAGSSSPTGRFALPRWRKTAESTLVPTTAICIVWRSLPEN